MKIHSPLLSPRFTLSPTERLTGRVMRNPDPEGHQQQEPKVDPKPEPKADPAPQAQQQAPDNLAELEALRAELAAERAKAAKFDGLDPEAARAAIAARSEAEAAKIAAEKAKAEADGNWERVRELMVQEHEATIKTLREENETLKTASAQSRAEAAAEKIGSAFSSSSFIAEKLALPASKARALYADHAELEDGKIVLYDKPKGADKRTKLVDGKGLVLGFDLAFEKIIAADPDKDRLLLADVKPGTASRGTERAVKPSEGKSRLNRIAEGLAKMRG